MRLTRVRKAAGLTAVGVLLAVGGGATSAQASPSAAYIGDGYTNNSHGVWCVQHLINDTKVFYNGGSRPMSEDGVWGPQTKSWVIWFQKLESLTPDGIVGKETGGYILRDGDSYYGGHNYCWTYVPSQS